MPIRQLNSVTEAKARSEGEMAVRFLSKTHVDKQKAARRLDAEKKADDATTNDMGIEARTLNPDTGGQPVDFDNVSVVNQAWRDAAEAGAGFNKTALRSARMYTKDIKGRRDEKIDQSSHAVLYPHDADEHISDGTARRLTEGEQATYVATNVTKINNCTATAVKGTNKSLLNGTLCVFCEEAPASWMQSPYNVFFAEYNRHEAHFPSDDKALACEAGYGAVKAMIDLLSHYESSERDVAHQMCAVCDNRLCRIAAGLLTVDHHAKWARNGCYAHQKSHNPRYKHQKDVCDSLSLIRTMYCGLTMNTKPDKHREVDLLSRIGERVAKSEIELSLVEAEEGGPTQRFMTRRITAEQVGVMVDYICKWSYWVTTKEKQCISTSFLLALNSQTIGVEIPESQKQSFIECLSNVPANNFKRVMKIHVLNCENWGSDPKVRYKGKSHKVVNWDGHVIQEMGKDWPSAMLSCMVYLAVQNWYYMGFPKNEAGEPVHVMQAHRFTKFWQGGAMQEEVLTPFFTDISSSLRMLYSEAGTTEGAVESNPIQSMMAANRKAPLWAILDLVRRSFPSSSLKESLKPAIRKGGKLKYAACDNSPDDGVGQWTNDVPAALKNAFLAMNMHLSFPDKALATGANRHPDQMCDGEFFCEGFLQKLMLKPGTNADMKTSAWWWVVPKVIYNRNTDESFNAMWTLGLKKAAESSAMRGNHKDVLNKVTLIGCPSVRASDVPDSVLEEEVATTDSHYNSMLNCMAWICRWLQVSVYNQIGPRGTCGLVTLDSDIMGTDGCTWATLLMRDEPLDAVLLRARALPELTALNISHGVFNTLAKTFGKQGPCGQMRAVTLIAFMEIDDLDIDSLYEAASNIIEASKSSNPYFKNPHRGLAGFTSQYNRDFVDKLVEFCRHKTLISTPMRDIYQQACVNQTPTDNREYDEEANSHHWNNWKRLLAEEVITEATLPYKKFLEVNEDKQMLWADIHRSRLFKEWFKATRTAGNVWECVPCNEGHKRDILVWSATYTEEERHKCQCDENKSFDNFLAMRRVDFNHSLYENDDRARENFAMQTMCYIQGNLTEHCIQRVFNKNLTQANVDIARDKYMESTEYLDERTVKQLEIFRNKTYAIGPDASPDDKQAVKYDAEFRAQRKERFGRGLGASRFEERVRGTNAGGTKASSNKLVVSHTSQVRILQVQKGKNPTVRRKIRSLLFKDFLTRNNKHMADTAKKKKDDMDLAAAINDSANAQSEGEDRDGGVGFHEDMDELVPDPVPVVYIASKDKAQIRVNEDALKYTTAVTKSIFKINKMRKQSKLSTCAAHAQGFPNTTTWLRAVYTEWRRRGSRKEDRPTSRTQPTQNPRCIRIEDNVPVQGGNDSEFESDDGSDAEPDAELPDSDGSDDEDGPNARSVRKSMQKKMSADLFGSSDEDDEED